MKNPFFVLLCSLIIVASLFISPGLAKDLFQVMPIVENYHQTAPENFNSEKSFVLAQAETDSLDFIEPTTENETEPDLEEDLDEDFFDDYEDEVVDSQMVADPIYPFNYAMYSFNDFMFTYAVNPIAKGYIAITPAPFRNGVNNFFYNLLFPVRFVNNILQGKLEEASDEIGIFLTNSTVGVLGLNQFAQKHLNMRTSDEDLGQTLGSYAIGDGFYLVLPVFGPSTLRDAIGRVGDYFMTPINYAEPWELDLALGILDKVNRTSFRVKDYETLKEASLNPYVAMRNAYIQNRRSEIER
jgi:phospholipid-binding lipoprotein MlaA